MDGRCPALSDSYKGGDVQMGPRVVLGPVSANMESDEVPFFQSVILAFFCDFICLISLQLVAYSLKQSETDKKEIITKRARITELYHSHCAFLLSLPRLNRGLPTCLAVVSCDFPAHKFARLWSGGFDICIPGVSTRISRYHPFLTIS